ncbi:MAG TPA: hypothetical protein VKU60_16190, partial [Chloroflexota bacterium]|nr:hypothetical protein [Chloroflexota bacterium]
MRAPPVWPNDSDTDEAPVPERRAASAALFAVVSALGSGMALALLVMTTDPDPRQERVFVTLLLVLAGSLGTLATLAFAPSTDRPLAGALRASRRGALIGLACAG